MRINSAELSAQCLLERTMLYPPWAGGSKSCSKPGYVVRQVVDAYLDAGGNGPDLANLLSRHIPEGFPEISLSELRNCSADYSCEFYFYLIIFTKYLLNDPYFRYSVDEKTQLDINHMLFEAGPLVREPWRQRKDDTNDEYLSIINMKAMFVYVERALPTPPFSKKGPADSGGQISTSALKLLNAAAPSEYQVDRSFFNQEAILISFEYLFYLSNVFICLTNDKMFVEYSLYYGFKNENAIARAIFNQPDFSPAEGLRKWQLRTSNHYHMEFYEKRRSTIIGLNLRRLIQLGIFGIYRESCIDGIKLANAGVNRSFYELATNRPAKTKILHKPTANSDFSIKIKWRSPIKSADISLYSATSGVLIYLLLHFLDRTIDKEWLNLVSTISISAAFCGISATALYWRRRLKLIKKRFNESQRIINRQLDSLTNRTEDLLNERTVLEDKVAERTSELRSALDQLKNVDDAKTNFLANVSHELRTPLTLLTLPFSEIRRGAWGETLPFDHPMFELVGRNIERIKSQMNRLLDFARLDLGKAEFHPIHLNLLNLCTVMVSELSSFAESRNLRLEIDNHIDSEHLIVEADVKLLETVLLNLLFNAIKFTEKGQVQVEFDEKLPGILALTIRDTGIGVAPEYQERIFNRFFMSEDKVDRPYEGTGLGLALVKQIAQLHGWDVQVESEVGVGSAFRLCMELLPDDTLYEQSEYSPTWMDAAESELLRGPGPASSPVDDSNETILIVEDNPDMGFLLNSLLIDEYNVSWCKSGSEALTYLNENQSPSLIISDVMMPEMSGIEFLKNLNQLGICSEIPFIFLTALGTPEDQAMGLDCGAIDYIIKPFSRNELVVKVKNILRTKNATYMNALRDLNGAERLSRMSGNFRDSESVINWDQLGITKSERRVIELVKEGLQDKEIAQTLGLSTRTVSTHLSHIYDKTSAQNRVELLKMLYSDDSHMEPLVSGTITS